MQASQSQGHCREKTNPDLDYKNANQWIDNRFIAKELKSLWKQTDDELLGLSDEKMPMGTWALACEFMLSTQTLGELNQKRPT